MEGKNKTTYNSVIEIIAPNKNDLFKSKILHFCKENRINTNDLFVWQSHWVLYAHFNHFENTKLKLERVLPSASIKLYKTPFYIFDRKQFVKTGIAKEWDNVIMTADLVKDTAMQHQYLEYHKTQFKKWPEIAQGFCNADFQQLLVFHNGRQLMLIISIPKGKTLNELNPLTVMNTPTMDQWNAIMSKYQVKIPDAPVGTTWVLFHHVK